MNAIAFIRIRHSAIEEQKQRQMQFIEKRLNAISVLEDKAIEMAEQFASGKQSSEFKVDKFIKLIARISL